MKSNRNVVVVRQIDKSREEELREAANLARMTGSEEDEINEIIVSDRILLADNKGTPTGFVSLRVTERGKALEITGLAVLEQGRRKGVAGLLLQYAESVAHSMNIQSLRVRTGNDNIPALKLYRKTGFKIIETKLGALVEHHGGRELAGWNGIPVRDEIILEKKL